MNEALLSRRYRVCHDTHYVYGGPITQSMQYLHLKPRDCPYQTCLAHALELTPAPLRRQSGHDCFGNPVEHVDFQHLQGSLTVRSVLDVRVHARPVPDGAASLGCGDVAALFTYRPQRIDDERLDASRFLHPSPHVPCDPMFREWAAAWLPPQRPVLDAAIDLMRHVHAEFRYAPGATDLGTSTRTVLAQRSGVCQDFAHVMIAGLRAHRIPARYVSGYIRNGNEGGHAMVGADASHAWVSVYCPPLGWIDLDPTNNCLRGTDHITVAWGRDFSDVSPLRGILVGSGRHALSVAVSVQPQDD